MLSMEQVVTSLSIGEFSRLCDIIDGAYSSENTKSANRIQRKFDILTVKDSEHGKGKLVRVSLWNNQDKWYQVN